MESKCKLNLITSRNEIIEEEITSLITESSEGKIEILPNHTDIIINTIPTKTVFIRVSGEKVKMDTSKGLIRINNNIIDFCCDTIILSK